MGLTICPDCGGRLSTHAASCPHCGRPTDDLVESWNLDTAEPDSSVSAYSAEDIARLTGSGKWKSKEVVRSVQNVRHLGPFDIVCPSCGYRGQPERKARGSFLMIIVLFALGILPGLLYVLFASGYNVHCPRCDFFIRTDRS